MFHGYTRFFLDKYIDSRVRFVEFFLSYLDWSMKYKKFKDFCFHLTIKFFLEYFLLPAPGRSLNYEKN